MQVNQIYGSDASIADHNSSNTLRPAQLSIAEMLRILLGTPRKVSNIILSPARPPQADFAGGLVEVRSQGLTTLAPEDTRRIAMELMGKNTQARQALETQGSCDLSYSVDGLSRFRVNI
ncbi:MAG: hypothetical protein ACRD3O_12295, partial [Terriglobia bacterium]